MSLIETGLGQETRFYSPDMTAGGAGLSGVDQCRNVRIVKLSHFRGSLQNAPAFAAVSEQEWSLRFKSLSPNQGTEVLSSIGAESREEVDEMLRKAVDAGGTVFSESQEKDGWMYGCGFADLDGHRWNALFMDMSKMPKNQDRSGIPTRPSECSLITRRPALWLRVSIDQAITFVSFA
jgi:hypothetical protein